MKRLLLILLTAILFSSCATHRHVTYQQPNGTIKLISYNIRFDSDYSRRLDGANAWDYRKEASLNMIEQEAPSAFGLQEAMAHQVQYIQKTFPQYKYVGVGRDDGRKAGEFMAIFYLKKQFKLLNSGTYWLSETPEQVSKGWDAACKRTVTWVQLQEKRTGKTFFYFNTHLDHLGDTARRESVKLIARLIDEKVPAGMPVILGGDMNSDIDSPIFAPLADIHLQNAREVAPTTDHLATFNGFGTTSTVIDHFFLRDAKAVSFHTNTTNYGVPFISDHYPIRLIINNL